MTQQDAPNFRLVAEYYCYNCKEFNHCYYVCEKHTIYFLEENLVSSLHVCDDYEGVEK